MSTQTLKYDRRKRQELQAAKAHARRELARAELTGQVKSDALKIAVTDNEIKSRLQGDITGQIFDALPAAERISILEDYIEAMSTLRDQMLEKFGSINGVDTGKQIKNIKRRIDAAGAEIVSISVNEIELRFKRPEPV